MPALPLDEAGKYVAAAYLVFLILVLVYVAIMAARLARIERELDELDRLRNASPEPPPRDSMRSAATLPAGDQPPLADRR